MKIKNILFIFIASALTVSILGCEQVQPAHDKENITLSVRVSEVSFDYARVTVKHNGPEDITWYGFLTTDIKTNESLLLYEKYTEILKSGDFQSKLRRETERNILLEDLKEETTYRYIAFGITDSGELYENVGMGSIEFKTGKNIYILTETKDWEINYLNRNEDKTKELIEIKANRGGRFAWNYISKESIENWTEEYPDGYELWVDDIYMTTVDGIQMYALEQISTIQYYLMNGYKIADLTYVYEAGKPFEIDRLSSGDYYVIVYGFNGNDHTQTYSVAEITIPEEDAEAGYTNWLGTYSFTGLADVTQENGDIVKEERTYNIKIEHYDNNFMYRVHGWECGDDVKYDWEEDIMQLDKEKDEYLAFPAYYKDGSLEIRETPMTYITFDGVSTLILGMYGYAYEENMKEEIPVLLENSLMALAAPIEAGKTTTQLLGQHGVYTDESNGKKTEWDYCKMGYLAWNEMTGAYQTVNPPLRFPITITKAEDIQDGDGGNVPAQTTGPVSFSTKKVSNDFIINKDLFNKKLSRVKPEIFDRQL